MPFDGFVAAGGLMTMLATIVFPFVLLMGMAALCFCGARLVRRTERVLPD